MRVVRRKWGFYIILLNRKHFKVKLLRLKKGKYLSHQVHKYRSELWLFLSGSGRLWNGAIHDEAKVMSAGEWDNIPANCWHTFDAHEPTYVLEIQYGKKCEESDIERI